MKRQNKSQRKRSKKTNKNPIFPKTTLPTSTKKRIVGAVKKSKLVGEIARTAQQTLPYEHMGQDGVCRVHGNYFTKTVEFYDITHRSIPRKQTLPPLNSKNSQIISFLSTLDLVNA